MQPGILPIQADLNAIYAGKPTPGYSLGYTDANPMPAYAPSAGAPPAATTNNTPAVAAGPTPQQIAATNQAASNARASSAINSGFGGVISNYDNQLGDIPGQIDSAGQLVNSQFDSQGKSIESAYGLGNSNLQYARDSLGKQTDRSLQKLAEGIRQSFDSYSTMIGAGGGGDSSANGQLSYALQKAEAQNRTDLYNNQADQNGSITQQQTGLDTNHADQIQKLGAWKTQQIISIGQQFHQLQQQIQTAKVGANKDRLLALASLNTDAVNQAVAALSGVTAQHDQGVSAINASLAKLQAPGDTAALSSANYNVGAGPGVQTPGISTSAFAPNTVQPGDSFASTPYYKKLAAA